MRSDYSPVTRCSSLAKLVEFRRKALKVPPKGDVIALRPETLDKAQKIAAETGYSLGQLEAEWNEWVRGTGKTPNNADAAFIEFCKNTKSHSRRICFGMPAQ